MLERFVSLAAIDLAGRDVLDAVRTSVSPKVIDFPAPQGDLTRSALTLGSWSNPP